MLTLQNDYKKEKHIKNNMIITNIKLYATTCKGVKCANKKPKT